MIAIGPIFIICWIMDRIITAIFSLVIVIFSTIAALGGNVSERLPWDRKFSEIMDNSRNGTGENQADNQTGGGPRRNTRHSINDNGGNGNGSRPPAAFEDTTNIMLPNNPENIGNGDYIESDINHENSYTPETNQSPSEAYRENDWKPF